MKLLFTQETDWLKRNPAQQHHLAEMLSLRGHEVRAIDYELLWRTEGRKEFRSKREVFPRVAKIYEGASVTVIRPSVIKLPLLSYVSLAFSHGSEISRQVNEYKPDAIVGWGILNSYLATKAARKNNIPFIYFWIDVLDRLIPFRPAQPLGKIVESLALKRADRVLAINDKLMEYVIRLGARPERTRVLRAGVDTRQFNPNGNYGAVRTQFGFKEKDTVLFFMGWLYNFSGLKEIALQLAKDKDHNLKLLIVGEGDAYEELRQIRDKYNLQDTLILTGKKPYQELPGLVAASDICLLPAYPEEKIMQDIVPIKMYEYMAMKKPVIATRLPGITREFAEGNGVVFVDRTEDVLPKAIELIEGGQVEQLGAKARSFVENQSWERITDEFEQVLQEVIKEKQR